MLHPDAEIRYINSKVGYGLFARQVIPKGTLTYVRDTLDITLPPDSPLLTDPVYGPQLDWFTYTDRRGDRVVCWDLAKFANHCCHANSRTTGYEFQIAVRDIQPGEQITEDYAMYDFESEMDLVCEQSNCRGKLHPSDFDRYWPEWEGEVKAALGEVFKVPQPLWQVVKPELQAEVRKYIETGEGYWSVKDLRPKRQVVRR